MRGRRWRGCFAAAVAAGLAGAAAVPASAATVSINGQDARDRQEVTTPEQDFSSEFVEVALASGDPQTGWSLEVGAAPGRSLTGLELTGGESSLACSGTSCTQTSPRYFGGQYNLRFRIAGLGKGETETLTATLRRDGAVVATDAKAFVGAYEPPQPRLERPDGPYGYSCDGDRCSEIGSTALIQRGRPFGLTRFAIGLSNGPVQVTFVFERCRRNKCTGGRVLRRAERQWQSGTRTISLRQLFGASFRPPVGTYRLGVALPGQRPLYGRRFDIGPARG